MKRSTIVLLGALGVALVILILFVVFTGLNVRKAVRGMLPHNRLGRAQLRKLKVYAGPTHPHVAQKPEALKFPA